MKIMSIPAYNSNATNNANLSIQQNNKTSFKGHTEKATPVYSHNPGGSGSTGHGSLLYYDVKGATPNYPGAYPNEYTKIYVAAPFEIVPEEAYKTHDYTRRTDMRFSDIKDYYKRTTPYPVTKAPLATNAKEEKEFLEGLLEKAINGEGTKNGEGNIKPQESQIQILKQTLNNANERFGLLSELDQHAADRRSVQDYMGYYSWMLGMGEPSDVKRAKKEEALSNLFENHKAAKKQHKETTAAFETLKKNPAVDKDILNQQIAEEAKKYDERYNAALKEAISLKHDWENARKWAEYEKDLPGAIEKIEQKMQACVKKIEKLYKLKYPHWV